MSDSKKTPGVDGNTEFERKLRLLNRKESRFRSWQLAEPGFEGILKELRETPPPPAEEEGLIYTSSGKRVWHLRRESGSKVYDFAYKTNPGKGLRYIANSSLPVREMRNYLLLESLGIPVPRILAVGDARSFFILKETFLATEFIADTRDGMDFTPGGPLYADTEKKMVFCRLHLEQLAKIHNADVFHKSYHPRNLLWRECGGEMEIFLIDVPRCRLERPSGMFRAAVTDLHSFFRDMRLPRAQTAELIAYYLQFRTPGTAPKAEEVLDALIHFRRRPFSRKKYKLFAEEG